MRNRIIVFLLFVATSAFGQLATVDAGMNSQFAAYAMSEKVQHERTGILEKFKHSETMQRWAEQLNNVREALSVAKDMKKDIERMYALQQDLKNAYEKIENIEEFSLADANYFLKYFLDIDLDPVSYIPNTPYTSRYIRDVRNAFGSPSAARAIFYADNSILNFTNGMIDYGDRWGDRFGSKNAESKVYARKIDQNSAIRAGLEENYGMLLSEKLSMLEEQIKKNVEDADRNRALANNKKASLSEGERAELNDKANRLMQSVMELKFEANDILVKLNTFEGRPMTLALKNENENYIVNRRVASVAYNKSRLFNRGRR